MREFRWEVQSFEVIWEHGDGEEFKSDLYVQPSHLLCTSIDNYGASSMKSTQMWYFEQTPKVYSK